MPPAEGDIAYLWDMREAARLILSFTEGENYASFTQNKLVQSAVERQLEIVGEAARYVSAPFRRQHAEIPWRKIVGLRNILAHEYGEIRIDRIWVVVEKDVPELIEKLNRLIPEDPGG